MDRANFISKVFFIWIYSLLRKVYNGNGKLSSEDIADVSRDYDCNELTSQFNRGLKKYKKKKVTATILLKTIWHLNSREMTISFALCALEEWVLKPGIAVLLGLLLHQMSGPSRDTFKELQTVLMISFMSMLRPFTDQHSYFLGTKAAMRARNALISVIYEKAMRLSYQGYSETDAGQIVNLVTNDVNELDMAYPNINYVATVPVQSIIVAVIIWYEMGSYSVLGVFMFMLVIVMQSSLGKVLVKLRRLKMAATDKRVKLMNGILTGIKVIKMYGWEDRFLKLLSDRRKDEYGILRKIALMNSINNGMMRTSIKLLILVTLTLYLLGDNGIVTAEKIFSMLSLFYSVRISIPVLFPRGVTGVSQVYSSLQRISEFLNLEESAPTASAEHDFSKPRISAIKAYASWNKKESALKNINFSIEDNDFLTIIGPVGSGKTSLLMLILRELHVSNGTVNVHGSIAYVPQESWIFSDTVLNNITFGKKEDYEKLETILQCTDFSQDVDSFPNGLDTLVGEKGIKLSGGQRSRLSLARSLYQDTDIYLLDDPLSAVDSKVGNRLYNQCIRKYLKNKLRVLVTHQIQYIKNDQKVILMNKGSIERSGTFAEIKHYIDKWKINLNRQDTQDINSQEAEIFRDITSSSKQKVDNERGDESSSYGGVPFNVYWNFFRSGASTFALCMFPIFNILFACLFIGSDYLLKIWSDAQQYMSLSLNQTGKNTKLMNENITQISNSTSGCSIFASLSHTERCNISSSYFLAIFSFLVLLITVTGILCSIYDHMVCIRASRQLHDNMFNKMLHVPMYFFNVNPIGRILNRFVKDVGSVDDRLPSVFTIFTSITRINIVVLVVVCIQNYYLTIVVILLVLPYLPISYVYFRTYQTLKRIDCSTKSPILSYVSTSLDGRTSIRAFNAVETSKHILCKLQNDNITSNFMFLGVEAWFAFSGDLIGAVLVCISTAVPVFLSGNGATVGFIFSQIANISSSSQLAIRLFSQLQSQFTSVERIMEYGNLTTEASKLSSPEKKPNCSWPEKGTIEFRNVSLRYKQTDPFILKSISFNIKSQEKIGIVGRTGSGKTSLVNALFRLTEPEGTIEIDGVVVNDIGLHDLRRKLSVIPQEPLLFADTLRYNLDPFDDHDDFTLWNALTDVGLENVVAALPHQLNTMIGGKTNLSFGESQLICLARAILKKNKILVLDEATSNVDHRTDELIQKTIRSKFGECTVLTIAHRINTIIDSDRILVMDEGNIIEFDSPFVLANDKSSKFYEIIRETGPGAETLLRIAYSQNI
ncbi:ABCC4 (predicted) [Pycnogonum litorale]